jgi:hypothetical protein
MPSPESPVNLMTICSALVSFAFSAILSPVNKEMFQEICCPKKTAIKRQYRLNANHIALTVNMMQGYINQNTILARNYLV